MEHEKSPHQQTQELLSPHQKDAELTKAIASWQTDNISDRQHSDALQQSIESLRLALEGANLGTWDYDLLTGRLLWSLQCKRLFGLVPDDSEITHEIFLNALHPEDRAWVDQAVSQAINEKSDYNIEYRTLWADGTVRWIAAKGRAIYNDTGQPIRMLGTTHDITERKEIEAERASILAREQAARAESEAAGRMKDEFLAIVSHELRTPLNSVLGWAELLRTRKFDSSKTAKAIETILRNAKLQVQLIEDLLDISRMMRGKIQLEVQQVNLISVIEAALDTLRLAAEAKSIDFKFTILDSGLELNSKNLESTAKTKSSIVCTSPPDTSAGRENRKQVSSSWCDKNPNFLVLGDVCRLQQIVWNLLSNAIKFTPNKGRVEVQLSLVTEKDLGDKKDKTIPNSSQASYPVPVACIQVIDTGKGIKPDFLNYVFERFRQADSTLTRSFGGLGLGLAIARQLVELHGGTISVASPGEGKGATFTVKLPLLKQTTHYSQLTTEKEKSSFEAGLLSPNVGLLKDLQILVVDDEPDIRDFIAKVLAEEGAIVMAVASAAEAIDVLVHLQPNVLVSDIAMPQEDGYSLIAKVRALDANKNKRLPAVALTAHPKSEDRIDALRAGYQTHVAKPVKPTELVVVIANLINYQC